MRARLRSHARPRGTCGGRSVTGKSSSVRMFPLTLRIPFFVVTIAQRCQYLTPWVNIAFKMTKCADFAIYQSLHLSITSVAILQTADVTCLSTHTVRLSSSVVTATRYGMDGPGFESRWGGRDFPHPSTPALGPTQPPIQSLLPEGKAAEWWRWPPTF